MTTYETVAARHTALASAVASGLHALAGLSAMAAGQRTEVLTSAEIDLLTVSAPGLEALAAAEILSDAAVAGHEASITFEQNDVTVTAFWSGTAEVRIELDGPASDLVQTTSLLAFEQAIATNRLEAVAAMLEPNGWTADLSIRPAVDGAHWVHRKQDLVNRLSDGRWGSTLLRLMPDRPHSRLPIVVLVADAASAVVHCPGAIFAGPTASLEAVDSPTASAGSSYREMRVSSGVTALPRPADLLPTPVTAEPANDLSDLRTQLRRVTRAVCWYWLAAQSHVGVNTVDIHFRGVRPVDLVVLPLGDKDPLADIRLIEWAAAGADAVRDDAVQQAVTLAVQRVEDLETAAPAVSRTARSLYELASRGLTSEALATRRAAREAALSASRDAAATARDVATKSVERAIALFITAGVAVFANRQHVLSRGATVVVVVLIAIVAITALVLARRVEIGSGKEAITAFKTDLSQYREALSAEDIESIANIESLKVADSSLDRAKSAASYIYGGAAAIALVGGLIGVTDGQSRTSHPTPRPSVTRSESGCPSGSVQKSSGKSGPTNCASRPPAVISPGKSPN